MKLYITPTSPYARVVRVVIFEKGLEDRIEIIGARTRKTGSPYYDINVSGRVPYLVREDGPALEDSALICAYLDQLDGEPVLEHPPGQEGWESRRLEARATSLLDGLAVWGREIKRAQDEQSPTVIEHERQRAMRMTDYWESEIAHPLMNGPLNMAQIVLVCALELERQNPGFQWRTGHPKLSDWIDRTCDRRSFTETRAP